SHRTFEAASFDVAWRPCLLLHSFCLLPFAFLPIPRLQHQPPRAILAVELRLLLLEHAERLAGEVGAIDIGGVAEVAQLVAGEPVGPGDAGVERGAGDGPPLMIPAVRRQREAVSRAA